MRAAGILFILLILFPLTSAAEVYKYVDNSGTTHYVTSPKEVPTEFRDQVKTPHSLPNIGKGDYSRYDDVKIRPAGGKRVEMYVTSWCGYCIKAEKFMKKNGIPFKKYNIETSTIGKKKHAAAGGGGVPVIKVGREIVRGFNEAKLRQLFDL